MTKWEKKTCGVCGGHGQRSSYSIDGGDFLGADECSDCGGSGQVFVSEKGVMAQWPGGPFIGRLTKQEMAKRY